MAEGSPVGATSDADFATWRANVDFTLSADNESALRNLLKRSRDQPLLGTCLYSNTEDL